MSVLKAKKFENDGTKIELHHYSSVGFAVIFSDSDANETIEFRISKTLENAENYFNGLVDKIEQFT